jgi:hypothetical protein
MARASSLTAGPSKSHASVEVGEESPRGCSVVARWHAGECEDAEGGDRKPLSDGEHEQRRDRYRGAAGGGEQRQAPDLSEYGAREGAGSASVIRDRGE